MIKNANCEGEEEIRSVWRNDMSERATVKLWLSIIDISSIVSEYVFESEFFIIF